MQVVAKQMGFYQGQRRRIGAVFEIDLPADKLPKWVKPVANAAEAKAEAEKVKAAAVKKQADGARAASGGAASRAKADAAAELAG